MDDSIALSLTPFHHYGPFSSIPAWDHRGPEEDGRVHLGRQAEARHLPLEEELLHQKVCRLVRVGPLGKGEEGSENFLLRSLACPAEVYCCAGMGARVCLQQEAEVCLQLEARVCLQLEVRACFH